MAIRIVGNIFQLDISIEFSWALFPTMLLVVGLGILLRDFILGLLGSFALIALVLISNFTLFESIDISKIILIIQLILFPTSIFIVLLINRKLGIKRNVLGDFFYSLTSDDITVSTKISKSCSNCGKSVSNISTVGDTCPHCGVRWKR